MPPISANARLLSNDVLAGHLLENFPFRIQLSTALPFLPIRGDRLRYATTGVLRQGVAIGHGENIPEDTKLPDENGRSHGLAELASQFRVSYKAQDAFSSNVNDQVAVQMALAVRELLYRFWTLFESGDASANANEFDGLNQLVDPARVLDLQGGGLRLEDLDRAKEQVRSNDGRGVVAFTSSVGKRAILAAHHVRGLAAHYDAVPVACPGSAARLERVLCYDGAPVYVNDLNQVVELTEDEPGNPVAPEQIRAATPHDSKLATNIWFFVLGPGNLHGIMPANATSIIVRSTILADASTLVYHVAMPVGIALGSAAALAVIRNAAIPT